MKRWANAIGRVAVYRTLVTNDKIPIWKFHSLKGIAYHRHLYSHVALGAETDRIERWLGSTVDEPAERVLAKVQAEERLTSHDWQLLLRFFAATQARTPAFYLRARSEWDTRLPRELEGALKGIVGALAAGRNKNMESEDKRTSSEWGAVEMPARVRMRPHEDGANVVVEAEILAGRQLWLSDLERFVNRTWRKLNTLHWTILRSRDGQEWMTSDDPPLSRASRQTAA